MIKQINLIGIILGFAILLSGCMYPEHKKVENQVPYESQINSVQIAVDQFREKNGGILPIKTRDAKTPLYQKYPIEFKRLIPEFLAEPPGNAFENGGIFQYVIIDAETKPKVKLLDLRAADVIRDVNLRISMYKETNGFVPFKDKIATNVFTLDYEKLGYKDIPFIKSPYYQHNLPLVISGEETIYVDYRMDLYKKLKESKYSIKHGDDIRSILVDESMIVPAYSLPYTIDENTKEPIFLSK